MIRKIVVKALDGFQRLAASSAFSVNIAVLIRNQCRCIIKYRLAESPNVLETGEFWFQQLFAKNYGVYVDVGANIGEWVDDLLKTDILHPKIFAYEPSESAFNILISKYCNVDSVIAFNKALGDRAGRSIFHEEPNAGKGSTFVKNFSRYETSPREVEIVTLEEEMARLEITNIDLLKIDAEGFDLLVIKGATSLLQSGKIGAIQFEYNRSWQLTGSTLFSAMDLLNRNKYSVYVLKKNGLYTLNYEKYEEYFEYTNFVAISPETISKVRDRIKGEI